MINTVTNVDTHLSMGVSKASSSLIGIPMPPILGFKTPLVKEKATLRTNKFKRSDNIIIVGDIDDDYVDIVEEEVKSDPLPKESFSFLKLPPPKKKIKYLKNCYIIDFIQAPIHRRGLGTEAIKALAEKVMFDSRAEGRVVTFSSPMLEGASPAIFFYKMGFRFMEKGANEYIAECIAKNMPDIPAQTGMMYLPRTNLHKLLRYGDKF